MKKVIKKIVWNIQGGYRPRKFWNKWADTFMEDPWQVQTHEQHKWILKKIKELSPSSILEIGCGFGRNIKFLIEHDIDPLVITGCDISPKMIQHAKKFIQNKKVTLMVADAMDLPFKDKSFDLTLVHGVFMHVKPEEIKKAIREALRVSKKIVINVEQNYPPAGEASNGNEYTFVHPYNELYRKLGGKVVEYVNNKKAGLDYFYVKVR